MFKSGFILLADAQLLAAQHNRTTVQAWQDGEALHHGAPIEKVTAASVKIAGQHFMRASCTFKVR